MTTPAPVIWLTGLPCSGKTTLAIAVERDLSAAGRAVLRLDGDELRNGVNSDLGFSAADRRENVRRTAEIARLAAASGIVCIVALVSPYRADRELAREIIGASRFFEVYLSASLAVCEGRDVKGMYRRARAGEIPAFTGVSDPYETPTAPKMEIDTGSTSIRTAAGKVLAAIK